MQIQPTPLEDAESLLINLEQELKNLNLQYESKQSERILSNHVWMTTVFEERLMPRANKLKESLVKIKGAYAPVFRSTTQFDSPLVHCEEIVKALGDVLYLYKIRANPSEIKMKMQQAMPKIISNLTSLRNRFYIVKGNVTRGKQIDTEDIFG